MYQSICFLQEIVRKLYSMMKKIKQFIELFDSLKILKISASLAYYALFSLPWFIFISIIVAWRVIGTVSAQSIIWQFLSALPQTIQSTIQSSADSIAQSPQSLWAAIIWFVIVIISATWAIWDLQDSFDMILWDAWNQTFIKTIFRNLLRIGVIVIVVWLLISISLLWIVFKYIVWYVSIGWQWYIHSFSNIVPLGAIWIWRVILYRYLPARRIPRKAAILWWWLTTMSLVLWSNILKRYIEEFATTSYYWAWWSIAVLLLWIYYSAVLIYCCTLIVKMYLDWSLVER